MISKKISAGKKKRNRTRRKIKSRRNMKSRTRTTSRRRIKKAVKVTPEAKMQAQKALKDTNLTGLCMTCYHRSGKTIKKRTFAIDGRKLKKLRNGRHMLIGICSICGEKMVKLI